MKVDFDFKKNKALLVGSFFNEIKEHFSISNPAKRFSRSWYTPNRLYAISQNGYFDIGLVHEIKKFMAEKSYGDLLLSDSAKEVLFPKLEKPLIKRLSKDLRNYQLEAVNKCLNNGRGVCLMATGAGKTLTMASLIDNFYLYSNNLKDFKCLVIVPDLGLVTQTFNDFKEYNVSFDVSMWTGSNNPNLDANVFIANIAILQSKFSSNEWLRNVDLLIVDEAHKLSKGNKIVKIIDLIKTNNKFGFTGTLPECKLDKWNVLGKIGPILIEKSSYELRNDNYLTNVEVKSILLNYKISSSKRIGDSESAYQKELDFIYNSNFRNSLILKTCSGLSKNILILVNHINHGEILYNILLQSLQDKKTFFIKGDVAVEDREKVKKIMEDNDNVICIAISSIFSTGVSINNIHYILFGSGGKSFVRIVQSIGRGLRLNQNKNKLVILDLSDNLYYGSKHFLKRQEIYSLEKIPFKQIIINEK